MWQSYLYPQLSVGCGMKKMSNYLNLSSCRVFERKHLDTNLHAGESPYSFLHELFYISIFLTILIVFICAPASAALVTDVQGNALSETLHEGSEISYSIVITGIPSQTTTLELSTDLIPVSSSSLWTIDTNGVTTDDSLNERIIHLMAVNGFPVSVVINVSGRVPQITTTTSVEGVVITKIQAQRSGYLYYNVKALDSQGKSLSAATTGTLTISVADEINFLDRTNDVDDPQFRTLITSMYSKGLTNDAWDVLEWYETKPISISVFVPVIVGIIALILGILVGYLIGRPRKEDPWE